MDTLIESLVFISSGLLIPCVAYLFILLAEALSRVVESLRTYRKNIAQVDVLSAWIRNERSASSFPDEGLAGDFGDCCRALLAAEDQPLASHLMSEYESHCEKRLGSVNRLVRLGPMTGLLGTLIPMGPALDGLANGDVGQLAGQMQVAFTTTVLGLVIGGIGFLLMQRELQLTRRQLSVLDFLCDSADPRSAQ